jgi:glucuronate isomerase
MPYLLGNPLYHWTHLELQRYFDIHEPLNKNSAPAIWKTANEKLQNDESLSVYGIFKKFNVYGVGTTDDPIDTLEWHEKVASAKQTETKVLPSFRPDKVINIEKADFKDYIAKLSAVSGKKIEKLDDLLDALRSRLDLFNARGCRASDHGLEYVPFALAKDGSAGANWEKEAGETFVRALAGNLDDCRSLDAYKTFVMKFFGTEYHKRGWVMQLHVAAIRSVNSRMFKLLGPDTGYDAVHDHRIAENLARFLDLLESESKLPKTILYSLNPKDFYSMGTIMGGFQSSETPGKIQLGSAWWFLDTRDGMEQQMKVLGNIGLLPRFIGMLTDSRSFLSYPRHEYFRRILCNILGLWAEQGEIPQDFDLLSDVVRNISFGNVKRYFS